MKSEKNFKMSFKELAEKGQKILAQQSPITLEKALAQVQRLKANSKVGQSSKKSRSAS